MTSFIFIFINIIIPIFIQIALGYGLQKKFNLNVNTMSKIQFYIFSPALLFTKIYETQLSSTLFISIVLCSLIQFCALYTITRLITKLLKYSKSLSSAFVNSVCLYNSGNYSLPLVQLLFNNSFAFSVQIINMMTQSILTNTVGLFNASLGSKSTKQAFIHSFKTPMIYTVFLALVLRASDIKVWSPLWSSLQILAQGLVPLALLTLGAQLANTKVTFKIPLVYLSNSIRLVISPILAYFIVLITGMQGIAAQVIVISTAAPTAVNTLILALECNNEPEFSSQAVFFSTVFSAITVSTVIYLVT